ncbi:MAG: DUF4147 domain-containing protein [Kofleriaceae bacterium]|nr:DUF4147 domain-containing protein [Kofleriaceae bacterium]
MAVVVRQHITAAVRHALRSCEPRALVANQVWDVVGDRPLFILAVGKAALSMASGCVGRAPIAAGLIVTHDGEAPAVPGFEILVASHPFPDQRSVSAAQRARAFVAAVPAHGVLLALISGGTSSLLAAPIAGVSLQAKSQVVRALMAAGANIAELNTVRAALSSIKAGGLVAGCAAPVVTWAISDVASDDIGMIGSGPTVGEWSNVPTAMPDYAALPAKAMVVARRFAVELPAPTATRLPRTLAGIRSGDIARVLAPRCALADAITFALGSSQPVLRLSLDDDSAAVAHAIVSEFAKLKSGQWLVAHGEPTVRLPAHAGPGGRMRDVALRLAIDLAGSPVQGLALASDGCDGFCPAHPIAGAWFDGTTAVRGAAVGLNLARQRDSAASASAFAALHDEFAPGLTGHNYADVVVLQRLQH